ncbi:hypothetical protein Cci01nite_16800 [Catellatospora citrea]|uniref:Uncharacterized protein n=1 Tax=Catellatospora citrea TaxID=53366 RepID=A0A8J3KAY9_9ACTN|nr:hypothetical protein Cci01nite_16800 [Catellatospora citrea]
MVRSHEGADRTRVCNPCRYGTLDVQSRAPGTHEAFEPRPDGAADDESAGRLSGTLPVDHRPPGGGLHKGRQVVTGADRILARRLELVLE